VYGMASVLMRSNAASPAIAVRRGRNGIRGRDRMRGS
jgi:hypothetical protein